MKISTDAPAFQPRSLTITFESQSEMDALASMANITPICLAVDEAAKSKDLLRTIRAQLQAIGASPNTHFESIKAYLENHFVNQ